MHLLGIAEQHFEYAMIERLVLAVRPASGQALDLALELPALFARLAMNVTEAGSGLEAGRVRSP